MATKTFNVSKQYMADTGPNGGGAANPGDKHIPIGKWDPATGLSWITRACLYAPISFSGMTAITEARLFMYAHTASGWHANGTGTHHISKRRKTSDWSETSGGVSSGVDELWGGNGSSIVTTGFVDEGDVESALSADHPDGDLISLDITEAVKDWFGGSPNYGIMLFASDTESDPDDAYEFYSRHQSGMVPYIEVTYTTNTTPNAPTNLSPSGSEIVNAGTLIPLSFSHSDPDAGDAMTGFEIHVYEDDGTTQVNSATLNVTATSSYTYRIGVPAGNKFYKWKVRTKDKAGAWGPFSSQQRFKANSIPSAPTLAIQQSPTTDLLTLTPTLLATHNDPDATDTKAFAYQMQVYETDGTLVWDSGQVALGSFAATTVTKTYNGPALSWGADYKWRARTQDANGAWSSYSGYQNFTTHKTAAPVSLSPTGGATVGNLTPALTGLRGDASDSLTSVEIEVYNSSGTTLIWSSGVFSSGVTSTGFSKSYAGTGLAFDTTYQWRTRVTASKGGTSDWTALQSFKTPSAAAIQVAGPVGPGITDLTPDFQFSRTDAFNAFQIVVYEVDGHTVHGLSGVVLIGSSVTSATWTYDDPSPLAWSNTYEWKVRVSADNGATWGGDYTDLIEFSTEEAGVPDITSPEASAWLGTPETVWACESIADVTNGPSASASVDTSDFKEGGAALLVALTSLNGSSLTYRTVAMDLSKYGQSTPIKVWVKLSSLTNVSTVRLRFEDALGALVEYDVKPATTGWEEKTATKGSPVLATGTIDWTQVTKIGVIVTTSASASLSVRLDSVRMDGSNPTFEGTAVNGETIDTVNIVVLAADQSSVVWNSGDVPVGATSFSVAYAGSALVPGSNYYWKARYTETLGPTGGFSPLQPFHLNSAPTTPTGSTPTSDAVVDSITPEFKSVFEDGELSSHGDTPSAFEVEVYDNTTGTLLQTLRATSNLAAGQNTVQRTTEGTALVFETEYKWRSRYADSMGQYGVWSSFNVFKPSEPPVTAITAPLATITSPSFPVTWSFSSAGGKGQNRYRVWITRDSDDVIAYDSGSVGSSLTSHMVPGGYLVNSTDYTVHVQTWDTDNLSSNESTQAITSGWAAPDALTGFSVSILEETSTLLLRWDQTNVADTDFSFYQIYRRESDDDEWTAYARITTKSVTEYSDYFAGNGIEYEYKVTVWKKVVGDVDIESSDSDIPTVTLASDVWFFIGADRSESHSFELPVTDEDHNQPVQQEVFEPLGSRRKSIVRGKVLGYEGKLEVTWLDSERTAAKESLAYLTETAGPHILKSPFGDVWQVEFGGPARKYSGGGHMAVTLTWIEVA